MKLSLCCMHGIDGRWGMSNDHPPGQTAFFDPNKLSNNHSPGQTPKITGRCARGGGVTPHANTPPPPAAAWIPPLPLQGLWPLQTCWGPALQQVAPHGGLGGYPIPPLQANPWPQHLVWRWTWLEIDG